MELVLIVLVLVVTMAGAAYFLLKKPTENTQQQSPKPTENTCDKCPTGQVTCPWPLDDCTHCCTKRQYNALLAHLNGYNAPPYTLMDNPPSYSKIKTANCEPDKKKCLIPLPESGEICCAQKQFDDQTEQFVKEFKKIKQSNTDDEIVNRTIGDIRSAHDMFWKDKVPIRYDMINRSMLPQIPFSLTMKPSMFDYKVSQVKYDPSHCVYNENTINNCVTFKFETEEDVQRLIKMENDARITLTNTSKEFFDETKNKEISVLNQKINERRQMLPVELKNEVAKYVLRGYSGDGTAQNPWIKSSNDVSRLTKKYYEYPRFKNKVERDKYFCDKNNCSIPNDYSFAMLYTTKAS